MIGDIVITIFSLFVGSSIWWAYYLYTYLVREKEEESDNDKRTYT